MVADPVVAIRWIIQAVIGIVLDDDRVVMIPIVAANVIARRVATIVVIIVVVADIAVPRGMVEVAVIVDHTRGAADVIDARRVIAVAAIIVVVTIAAVGAIVVAVVAVGIALSTIVCVIADLAVFNAIGLTAIRTALLATFNAGRTIMLSAHAVICIKVKEKLRLFCGNARRLLLHNV